MHINIYIINMQTYFRKICSKNLSKSIDIRKCVRYNTNIQNKCSEQEFGFGELIGGEL